ncbi:MAG: hypothetical protein WCG99_05125 [Candidatus Berkelbacteria bacterium]
MHVIMYAVSLIFGLPVPEMVDGRQVVAIGPDRAMAPETDLAQALDQVVQNLRAMLSRVRADIILIHLPRDPMLAAGLLGSASGLATQGRIDWQSVRFVLADDTEDHGLVISSIAMAGFAPSSVLKDKVQGQPALVLLIQRWAATGDLPTML